MAALVPTAVRVRAGTVLAGALRRPRRRAARAPWRPASSCEYGGDPRWVCNTIFTCTGSGWSPVLGNPDPTCPTINSVSCPASPSSGDCSMTGLSCNYSTAGVTNFCDCTYLGGPIHHRRRQSSAMGVQQQRPERLSDGAAPPRRERARQPRPRLRLQRVRRADRPRRAVRRHDRNVDPGHGWVLRLGKLDRYASGQRAVSPPETRRSSDRSWDTDGRFCGSRRSVAKRSSASG